MKKLLLISFVLGASPLAMMAQNDDLYFVPKKKNAEKTVTDSYGLPKETYYSGSNRSVDDYNRRGGSYYEVIDDDSTKNDIIDFSAVQGVYPDSLASDDDFQLTRQMTRFDDYDVSDNAAFWAGYHAGRSDWGWHSPFYYGRYGWYDPWYYGGWGYGWYDPWHYGYAGWYGWYDPWYYGYGWGYPYYHGWYGYHGWGYPYYYGGAGRSYAFHNGNSGTINRNGSTRGSYRGATGFSGSRMSNLRSRSVGSHRAYGNSTVRGNSNYSSGNSVRSGSGNFSGSRSSSFSSGSSTRSSGGGSFSGGGSRGGGGSLGGRR